jgi:hypothetical protein
MKRLVPLWLKIGFSIWLVAWAITYAQLEQCRQHFLWMCRIGLFIMATGRWRSCSLPWYCTGSSFKCRRT